MAIAKHFVHDGFWGVSMNGFSSTSSSPLWTFIIAIIYKATGIKDGVPLYLNLFFGSIFVFYCHYIFRNIPNMRQLLYLLLIILLIPLPILTLTGMEHILHALITIYIIYSVVNYLTHETLLFSKIIFTLLIVSTLLLIRYEGIFLLSGITFLFLVKKRFGIGILTTIVAILPMSIYGLYSMHKGWFFIPNAIIMKGVARLAAAESIYSFFINFLIEISANSYVIVLTTVPILISLLSNKGANTSAHNYSVFLFVTTFIMHILFARLGWFFRYEAYLIAAGLVLCFDMLESLIPENKSIKKILTNPALLSLLILLFLPLITRAERAFKIYPFAVKNCYEQMYQVGLFLKKFYSGKTVVSPDIGAINYLADIKLIDLAGLGNAEIIKAKKNRQFDKNFVKKIAIEKNAQIVATGKRLFENCIPDEWIEVGQWHINDNVLAGDSTIYFYAPHSALTNEIAKNLAIFSKELPPSVVQSGLYLNLQHN